MTDIVNINKMATDAHVIVEGLGHFEDIESLLAAMKNDSLFNDNVDEVINDIQVDIVCEIQCTYCEMKCKSNGGMKRHICAKHP